jgi:formylglycine-generating enzyme required for sulfatase activity
LISVIGKTCEREITTGLRCSASSERVRFLLAPARGGAYPCGTFAAMIRLRPTMWLLASLAGWPMAGCQRFAEQPGEGEPSAIPVSPAPPPAAASVAQPFVNSLGMRFIPLSGSRALLSVWETRNQDFTAFLHATGRPVPAIPPDKQLHPAAGVSWNDAAAFCHWLTEHERRAGRIGPEDRYRLPRDREWSAAVGNTRYPWGEDWPKTEARGNLAGYKPAGGDHTAPVGSHPANALGFHDLGGNVFEWCLDWYYAEMNPPELRLEFERLNFDGGGAQFKVLRGASWVFFDSLNLVSAYRYFNVPEARSVLYGFRCVLERDALGQGQPPPVDLPPWMPPVADARSIAGRETYRGNCVECHQYYDPVLYPDGDWGSWLQKMKGKAKLGYREFRDLSDFTSQIRKRS